MKSEIMVFQEHVSGLGLFLSQSGVKLGVEGFIPGPAVDELRIAVLKKGSLTDMGDFGADILVQAYKKYTMNSKRLSEQVSARAGIEARHPLYRQTGGEVSS